MKEVRTIVLRAAGTNCDLETAYAFSRAGSLVESVHINRLVSKQTNLSDYDILAIPGGFTYGDDIASGRILANEIKSFLAEEFMDFIESGKLVIGICNGFQVLVKMGILPDTDKKHDLKAEVTLALNDSGVFTDRWVYLKNNGSAEKKNKCVWTLNLPEVVYFPVAHAEGKFISKDEKVLKKLQQNEQIVFQYCDKNGRSAAFPDNPNGSVDDIAGISDTTGRVLGLMPHPERYTSYLQHPNWRRKTGIKDMVCPGSRLFENGVEYVKTNLQRI